MREPNIPIRLEETRAGRERRTEPSAACSQMDELHWFGSPDTFVTQLRTNYARAPGAAMGLR